MMNKDIQMLQTIASRIIDRYPEMYDRLCEYIARVENGGWLPIETAPKDGSNIILWAKYGDLPLVGRYSKTYDEWLEAGGTGYKFTPTHWQPLPQTPAKQEG